MLPNKWKIVLRNNTGGACTVDKVAVTPWNFAADGSVAYGGEIDLTGDLADPGNGNDVSSTEQINTSDKYFGFKGIVKGTRATPSGALEIYIEWPDATGIYPSSQTDKNVQQDCIQLAALTPGAGGRATNFTYE